MDKDKVFGGWIASLSNGDTVFEQDEQPGEPTSWRKLVDRCEKENLHLTQIRLQLSGLTFVGIQDADGYCTFWKYSKALYSHKETFTRCIGSVVGNKVFITEVFDNGTIKQDLVDYDDIKIHCITK